MSRLTWLSETQKSAEFAFARKKLRFPDKQSIKQETSISLLPFFSKDLTYTYIVDPQNVVYAQANDELNKNGTSGSVKLLETEDGHQYVLKKAKMKGGISEREFEIAKDLKLATQKFQLGNDVFVILNYFGENLSEYMKKNGPLLTDLQRLILAIKINCALLELHEGLTSETGMCYAHLDIKRENITIDKDGNVRLIDCGFSQRLNDDICRRIGTPTYMINLSQLDDQHAALQHDIYAYLNLLCLPARYQRFVLTKNGHLLTTKSGKLVTQFFYERPIHNVLTDTLIQRFRSLKTLFTTERFVSLGSNRKDAGVAILPIEVLALLAEAMHQLEQAPPQPSVNLSISNSERQKICGYLAQKAIILGITVIRDIKVIDEATKKNDLEALKMIRRHLSVQPDGQHMEFLNRASEIFLKNGVGAPLLDVALKFTNKNSTATVTTQYYTPALYAKPPAVTPQHTIKPPQQRLFVS